MSRIGKLPVSLPSGVEVTVADDNTVSVKGPKGQLSWKINQDMKVEIADGQVTVTRPTEEKKHRAMHGLSRSLIQNMVTGVSTGFEKSLDIEGVGYRAQKAGTKLTLTVGYSHPVEIEEPEGITFDVPAQNKIIVKGIDKQAVGSMAAKIRAVRKPEVYHGKGIRYTGEIVHLKAGKSGKA